MALRLSQLFVGLLLYGFGAALTVRAGLGVDPWTVLAQGISRHTGVGVGWVTNGLGVLILLLWIPLRQRPGFGTIANILLLGTSMQVTLDLLPPVDGIPARIAVLVAGILSVAVASGLYIGAALGPGPRDGLMTGLRDRFGWPTWAARTSIEATVLAVGWVLGGDVGIGTIAYAASIGPLVHLSLSAVTRARAHLRTPVTTSLPSAGR